AVRAWGREVVMASWILVLAAIGSDGTVADVRASESGGGSSQATERSFHEFYQRISDLLKRESQTKDLGARAAAVRAMCGLHAEIVHDSRYANSDVLKEYRGRLWSRLTKIKAELKPQLARNQSNREAVEDLATPE